MTAGTPAPQREWAYFFDIDGTLVEIADSPARVHVDPALRELIATLHRDTRGAVALISGRSLSDIDTLFPGGRLPAAGQHGAEWRDASGTVSYGAPLPARFEALRRELTDMVARHSALLLEDKGRSLAVHYRAAPRLGGYVHRVMRALQARYGAGLVMQHGKLVAELLPAGVDKGKVVRRFMRAPPFCRRTPVFIGDDVTDEAAFAAVNRLGGHSFKVGPGVTCARRRFANVTAVRAWLEHAAPPPDTHHRIPRRILP